MCKYCKERTSPGDLVCGPNFPIVNCNGSEIQASILDGSIMIWSSKGPAYNLGYIDINFCPMCGRKLRKESET